MTVPFFVADRPMSLRLLKGLPLQQYPGVRIGIMAHANTTANFQEAFSKYPCDDLEYCDAIGGPCKYRVNMEECPSRQYLLEHTIKMCDSGIFTREGATLTYHELFKAYARMNVEYGIMIDVFQNVQATLTSAENALQHYAPYRDRFKLIGVAQGDTLEDYLECYARLQQMGFDHIAVGGLLRRRENTVRFPYVRDQEFMFRVLAELRRLYPTAWLFALGCFHPSRLVRFQELGVWADYKGWIFQYKNPNESVLPHLKTFASNHLEHLGDQIGSVQITALRRIISLLQSMTERRARLSQELVNGRRTLRASLRLLYVDLQDKLPDRAPQFRDIVTHGLLDKTEERRVKGALRDLGKKSDDINKILKNIQSNRELKRQIEAADSRIRQANSLLARIIVRLTTGSKQLPEDTRNVVKEIADIIGRTEREHRFEQVRRRIAGKILALL